MADDCYLRPPVPRKLGPIYALAFLYTQLGRKAEIIEAWERIIGLLGSDYHIRSGETVDWAKREIEALQRGASNG